jgi:osmotically-inducible protein OsmY
MRTLLWWTGIGLTLVGAPVLAQTRAAPDPNVAIQAGQPTPPPTADPNIRWSQDARISALLFQRFTQDDFRGSQINVDSERGQVLLRGVVPNPDMIALAIQVARQQPGVVSVRSNLQVQATLTTAPNTVPETQ